MMKKLPTRGFAWGKVDDFTLKKEYPKELHKKHNELSFSAERMKIGKVKKLVPNLKDVCSTHQKSESSIEAWFEIEKDTSGH